MKMLSYTTKRLSWGVSALLEAWGTLWTQPVAAVNETSPVLGQAGWTQRSSKRKRTLAEGGGFLSWVAWLCYRVCRSRRHGRVTSSRACHAFSSGSLAGMLVGHGAWPGGTLLLLASLGVRGQWLPWSSWSECPEIPCTFDNALSAGQDFHERTRFEKLSLLMTFLDYLQASHVHWRRVVLRNCIRRVGEGEGTMSLYCIKRVVFRS